MNTSALVLRCDNHPTYKAIKEPTADCNACRALWEITQTTPGVAVLTVAQVQGMHHAVLQQSHRDLAALVPADLEPPKVTEAKVEEVLEHLRGRFGDTYRYEAKESKKYFKIIMRDIDPASPHESVYCFIAKVDNITNALGKVAAGDLLKPASWSQPAKHARGSLFDKESWWKSFDKYGMLYLA